MTSRGLDVVFLLNRQRTMTPYTHTRLFLITALLLKGILCSFITYAQEDNPAVSDQTSPEEIIEEETVENKTEEIIEQETPVDPETYQKSLTNKARLESLIASLESSSPVNIDSAELAKAYADLAQTLSELDQHEQALEAFDLALQTTRMRTGLNSPEQLPILHSILKTYEKQGEWQALVSTSHLAFHISRRSFDVGDQRRINALLQLGSSQMKSARENTDDRFDNTYFEVATLYRTEIELLEGAADTPEKNIQLSQLYLGEAAAKLETAKLIFDRPLSDYGTTSQRTIRTQVCRNVPTADGRILRVCDIVETPDINNFVQPYNIKYGEIQRNLRDTRESIISAVKLLQADGNIEMRDILLAQVDALTIDYNTFVSENSN